MPCHFATGNGHLFLLTRLLRPFSLRVMKFSPLVWFFVAFLILGQHPAYSRTFKTMTGVPIEATLLMVTGSKKGKIAVLKLDRTGENYEIPVLALSKEDQHYLNTTEVSNFIRESEKPEFNQSIPVNQQTKVTNQKPGKQMSSEFSDRRGFPYAPIKAQLSKSQVTDIAKLIISSRQYSRQWSLDDEPDIKYMSIEGFWSVRLVRRIKKSDGSIMILQIRDTDGRYCIRSLSTESRKPPAAVLVNAPNGFDKRRLGVSKISATRYLAPHRILKQKIDQIRNR